MSETKAVLLELGECLEHIKLTFQAIEHARFESPRLPDPYDAIMWLGLQRMEADLKKAENLYRKGIETL